MSVEINYMIATLGERYPNLNNWSLADKRMQSGDEPNKVDS